MGDRFGLAARPGRVAVGRCRCGLSLQIAGHDPGAIGHTQSRPLIPEDSESADAARPRAPVAATSPQRPGWVVAKPEVVGTGSRPSDITKGIMRGDLVVMARMEGRAVEL